MICGFDRKQSYQIGLGMVCRGEVALIVAGKGMAMNLISEDYLGPIVIMIIVCTIITPIFLKRAFKGQDDVVGNTVFEDAFMVTEQADELAEEMFHKRLLLSMREQTYQP